MALNSLFAKIFLWFWLTIIAVAVATAWSAANLHRQFGADDLKAHFASTQAAYAEAASAILESGGVAALGRWLHQLSGRGGLPGRQYVFDNGGKVLFGPPADPEIEQAISALADDVRSPSPIDAVFFEPIYEASGERYWFVSDMRFRRGRPPGGGLFKARSRHRPEITTTVLLVAILVSGVVCYALARYLTRPIRRLQAATKDLAAGNFGKRVATEGALRGDELGDLSRDFDAMAERLERLHNAQSALLRDVSHELRSPLARLQVALGLAQQRDDGRSQAELARIELELAVLDELIAQLLSVARLEAAEVFATAPVDMNELLRTVARDASFEGSELGKSVQVDAADLMIVHGDRSLLKSAVENVIRNAIRHTPNNTIVEVRATVGKNGHALIGVRDFGDGVPDDVLEELFKPFVRVDAARDRESGGYGVGLAITSAAIRRHGGDVAARNHPDGGLEVNITLPLAAP